MPDMEIKIIHIYPDLLNLYGDKGNISSLVKRLEWRDIGTSVFEYTDDNCDISFKDADIIFMGGGSDREQEAVCKKLTERKEELLSYIENDGVFLATCGGFEMIGKYYFNSSSKVEGLGLVDICAETSDARLIGDVILDSPLISRKIVGFENHLGGMNIGSYEPLGKLIRGHGNDGKSGYEGLIYKNLVATYLHGPVLPKNPMLCDLILLKALKKKYPDFKELAKLNDKLEGLANDYIINKFLKE